MVDDRYGHAAGDVVIRALADLIRDHCRPGDIAARFGGEEFVLVLPETRPDVALAIAERIRAAAEPTAVEHEGCRIAFTTSVGVAALAPRETLDEWIARADAALYRAKQSGRNRVIAAGKDTAAP